MRGLLTIAAIILVICSLQGCASAGSGAGEIQSPVASTNGTVTGQNMNYMYRSPSYQVGRLR